MRDWYRTIVVGSGPAGAMAAAEAAKAGPVLLAEASSLPRDKSCGGMLHELSQRFLSPDTPVPAEMVLEPGTVRFRYVDWDRGIRKPTDLRFLNVDRAAFDAWLLQQLPDTVEVAQRTRLEGFEQHGERLVAKFKTDDGLLDVGCETLIGADGARSKVRRTLGLGSVSTYVTLQDWVSLHEPLEPFFDCIYMRDVGDRYAYSYLVPKGDRAIVGSVYYPGARKPQRMQDRALEILRERIPQLGASSKREASVALYVRRPEDVVPGIGRVLLAGEAAGFMSPTSGEGISYALRTGRLAGSAVAEADPDEAVGAYRMATASITGDIRRRLRWLPLMESSIGKYLAGFAPVPLVSKVTQGL